MSSFSALASTSPTSTPPSCVKRIQSPWNEKISVDKQEDPGNSAYLANGVDVDVIFSLLGVGNKGLNEELPQKALDGLDLLLLAGTRSNPLSGLWPCLVQAQEATLASSLDQLVGLCDEPGALSEQPRVCVLSLLQDTLDGSVFGEVDGSKLGGWVMRGGSGKGRGLDRGRPREVVVEDGLAISFEDRLCGHGVEKYLDREKSSIQREAVDRNSV